MKPSLKYEGSEEETKHTSPSTPGSDDVPYLVFTTWQMRWINITTLLAAMFSTLSSYIYSPGLIPISEALGVSSS